MVEMIEQLSILNNLSDRSLVIMDEIGRTSTYDGVSIAFWPCRILAQSSEIKSIEHSSQRITNELNQLTEDLPRIKNFNVAVKK
jgi:DNA mismatch repair protein MutS